MLIIVSVALGFALLCLLRVLWSHHRRLESLNDAIKARQPFLHEHGDSAVMPAWAAVISSVNAMLAENETLQQQRSDQLAQLEATLGNLREAVMIVDESNYLHLANRALRDIFPAVRDIVNLRLEIVVRSAAFHQFVAAIRAGDPLPRQEFEVVEGTNTRWIEASGAPIPSPDGKSQWALFVIHDMTSQRRLERVRRDFVANASHELRTPLSIIKGYIETLVDGHQDMTPEERDRFLRTVHRHSERLNAIIQDLLTLSRLESGPPALQPEQFELGQFLEAQVDDCRRRPAAAGYELIAAPAPDLGEIEADPARLHQVLGNLLDNALKHTPKGTRIELTATAVPGAVQLAVRDNGPGIPAADLPHLFERFYRVDKGRSRETGGTGLGLSIVKHIVQQHGGRTWIESELGRGTTVFVQLPRSLPPTARPATDRSG